MCDGGLWCAFTVSVRQTRRRTLGLACFGEHLYRRSRWEFFSLCSQFLDAALKGITGKDMCSKAGEDGPLLFPFVNISCRPAICNADAEVIRVLLESSDSG